MDCTYIKEAVDGTTLTDNGSLSFLSPSSLSDFLQNAVELSDAFLIDIACLLHKADQRHPAHHPLQSGIVLHRLRHIPPGSRSFFHHLIDDCTCLGIGPLNRVLQKIRKG